MNFKHSFKVVIGFSFLLMLTRPVQADQSEQVKTEPGKFVLAYRVASWKSLHFNDPEKAKEQASVFGKLGCELQTTPHNGHTDLKYRTRSWKAMELESKNQIELWLEWFSQTGFETLYGYDADVPDAAPKAKSTVEKPEKVRYRAAQWQSQHIDTNQELAELASIFRGLGCEWRSTSHAGHTDASYCCPAWKEVVLPSHEAAQLWQDYLQRAGFETQHSH
ncbi:MAG: hypothetical protein KDB03_06540 [Planctomycetales bacterium]|nr:hypothetical protein [Planctomycetales bacterium]